MSNPSTQWRGASGRPIESALRHVIRDGRISSGYARWVDRVEPHEVPGLLPGALHTIAGRFAAASQSLDGVRLLGLPPGLPLCDGQPARVEGCLEPREDGPAFRAFAVQALDRAPERACGGFLARVARAVPSWDGNHSGATDAFFAPDYRGGAALVVIDGTPVRERNRERRGEFLAGAIAGYCRSRTDPGVFSLMDDGWPPPVHTHYNRPDEGAAAALAILAGDVVDALDHRDHSELVDGAVAIFRPGVCAFVRAGQARVYHVRGREARVVAWEHTLARESPDPARPEFANVNLSCFFGPPDARGSLPPAREVALEPGDHLVFVGGRSMRALPDDDVAAWVALEDFDAAARAFEQSAGGETWCLARVTWTGEPDRGATPRPSEDSHAGHRTWVRLVREGDLPRCVNAAAPAWVAKQLREPIPVCVTARYDEGHFEEAHFEGMKIDEQDGLANGEYYRVEGWCIPRNEYPGAGFNGPWVLPFAVEAVTRGPARARGGFSLEATRSMPADATHPTRPSAPPLGPFDALAAPHAGGVLVAVVTTESPHLLRAAFRRSLAFTGAASLFCLRNGADVPSPVLALPQDIEACVRELAAGLRALDARAGVLVLHAGPQGVVRTDGGPFRVLRVRQGSVATLPARSGPLAAGERLVVRFGAAAPDPRAAPAGDGAWGAVSIEPTAPARVLH